MYDTEAFCPGTLKTLPWFCVDCIAEIGRMVSAVGGESGIVKNVAVRVVLYIPV